MDILDNKCIFAKFIETSCSGDRRPFWKREPAHPGYLHNLIRALASVKASAVIATFRDLRIYYRVRAKNVR